MNKEMKSIYLYALKHNKRMSSKTIIDYKGDTLVRVYVHNARSPGAFNLRYTLRPDTIEECVCYKFKEDMESSFCAFCRESTDE